MNFFLCLLISLITLACIYMSGCANTLPIPVAIQAPVKMPYKPALAINKIRGDTSHPEIIKLYVVSLNQCMAYALECSELLEPYSESKSKRE